MNMAQNKQGRFFLPFKMMMIGLLTLLLLIPVAFISSIIDERQSTNRLAVAEIGHSWGDPQKLGGPLLIVPYKIRMPDDKGTQHVTIHRAFILPDDLNIEAELTPEKRQRGIYETAVYRVSLKCSGQFSLDALSQLRIPPGDLLWDDAFLVVGIPDMRGITEAVSLSFASTDLHFNPGTQNVSLFPSGIHAGIEKLGSQTIGGILPFSFSLSLNGSQDLSFVPLGKETRVTVRSSWPDPSFSGAYLPSQRHVTNDGFDATWAISYFGRNYPQFWTSANTNPTTIDEAVNRSSFGVRLLIPVDFYHQVTRAAKYAILFVALTFLVFFLHEVFNPLRIHPLQYLLVGFALCLFYLLLLSASEYLSFGVSYLLGGAATVILITGYTSVILKNKFRSFGMGLTLSGLYVYLYILLQIEEYALLIGSIGLFAVLAVIMYITRHVDWYALKLTMRPDGSGTGAE